MVYSPLAIGGFIGVLISGGFVYWEVGKYAAPQVPRTRFVEPKALWAYTAGLFVGVPIAVIFRIYQIAVASGSLIFSGLIDIAILVAATEIAQWLLSRSRYFGVVEATPFYALCFRAAVGGILIVAAVAVDLLGVVTLWSIAVLVAQSFALLVIEVAGALQSIPRAPWARFAAGGPVRGAVVGAVGFIVLGVGSALGPAGVVAAALLVIAALVPAYRRLRARTLDQILDPEGPSPERSTGAPRPFERRED